MATVDTDKLLTSTEAAEILGLSKDSVKKYCQTGALEAIKLGRSWFIEKKEVMRYKRENLGNSGRPPAD